MRPGHDEECEWSTDMPDDWTRERLERLAPGLSITMQTGLEECRCAVRAYRRDPYPGAELEPVGDGEDFW